jgi:hypothetical protein
MERLLYKKMKVILQQYNKCIVLPRSEVKFLWPPQLKIMHTHCVMQPFLLHIFSLVLCYLAREDIWIHTK